MAQLKVQGNASGTGVFTVTSPNSNNTQTLTLPDTTGTLYVPGTTVSAIQSGTAVASTSGTSIDFTSIPSWVKRITVMFNGVSTSGTSLVQAQIGAGSVTTSGYTYYGGYAGATNAAGSNTYSSGFVFDAAFSGGAALLRNGVIVLTLLSGNTWVCATNGGVYTGTGYYLASGGGNVTLSGTLDRVRITTVNGTDTFDAGSINILYE